MKLFDARAAFDSMFMKALTEEANKIAQSARDKSSWSSTIKNAISVGVATTDGNDKYSIDIIVDTDPDTGAPQAPAFEYGSGLHATKYSPQLYPIEAVNAPNLVFWWEKGGKWFKGTRLPFGHPGVAPRPFLKPAMDENRLSFKNKALSLFKRGLFNSIKAEFADVQKK
jgi:hypothetical protein